MVEHSVYVLTEEFDCEGESPIAVFGTLEKAKAAAELKATDYGREPLEWAGPKMETWRMSHGSSHLIIRKEVVQ